MSRAGKSIRTALFLNGFFFSVQIPEGRHFLHPQRLGRRLAVGDGAPDGRPGTINIYAFFLVLKLTCSPGSGFPRPSCRPRRRHRPQRRLPVVPPQPDQERRRRAAGEGRARQLPRQALRQLARGLLALLPHQQPDPEVGWAAKQLYRALFPKQRLFLLLHLRFRIEKKGVRYVMGGRTFDCLEAVINRCDFFRCSLGDMAKYLPLHHQVQD